MLERLADEANHFLSGADEKYDNPSSETLDDMSSTIRTKQERLLTALQALSDARRTVVMVIDGLDKLDAQSKIGKVTMLDVVFLFAVYGLCFVVMIE